MGTTQPKPGRARQYNFSPAKGVAHANAAYAMAMLDECSARLFDLIDDLPLDALDAPLAGGPHTIAQLVRHMADAEAGWIARVTQTLVPDDLAVALEATDVDAAGLVSLCRRVRDEITTPRLQSLDNIHTEVESGGRTISVRGVLMHLVWHWTYRTGQVGLLRGLTDRRYAWKLPDSLTGASN